MPFREIFKSKNLKTRRFSTPTHDFGFEKKKVAAHPAVLPPSINLHVAAVVGILEQAVVLEEQPGALAQSLALVVVILLDELLHQLEQTLRVPSIPLDQVLRWKSEQRCEHVRATALGFIRTVERWWICSLGPLYNL